MDFARKWFIFVLAKRREPINSGFSPLFLTKKNGIFTSEVEKSTLLRKIFLGVCGKFLRNIGVRGGDSEDF